MTHEEKAREKEVEKLYKYISNKYGFEPLFEMTKYPTEIRKTIAEALASAEKKGREESEKEIKTLNGVINDMFASDEEIYCRGWNEAIAEAANVALKCELMPDDKSYMMHRKKEIAESIQQLKRG